MSDPATDRRVSAIDAARGAAMVMVCLSHFAQGYFGAFGDSGSRMIAALHRATFMATPTFVVISGAMLGLLYDRHQGSFDRTQAKLIDRGLFLLVVGHLATAPPHYVLAGSWSGVAHYEFITDTIGCCLIAGPLLVPRLNAATRVIVGTGLFVASWILVLGWHPQAAAVGTVKDLLVGPSGATAWRYNFPILPWFGVYLASTTIGSWMAPRAARGEMRSVAWTLGLAGACAMAAALLALGLDRVLEANGSLAPAVRVALHRLTSPMQKWPPTPGFILAYGGAGLVLTAACSIAHEQARLRPLTAWLTLLGRTSLVIFIAEYYLYVLVLHPLHLRYVPWWPVYFLLSLLAITALARAWDARQGNRLFTVGYPPRRPVVGAVVGALVDVAGAARA